MKKSKSRKILWVTDPWETLDHRQDTTLRLAQEAMEQGFVSYGCDSRAIRARDSEIVLEAREFLEIPPDRTPTDIRRGEPALLSPCAFTAIHYRPDPPIGLSYLHPLQLLWSATRDSKKTEIINPAPVLILAGEKTEAMSLAGFCPPSFVSAQWNLLQEFGRKIGKTVLKPLNSAQSKGIELIDWTSDSGTDRTRALIEKATEGFRVPVLLQRFLPEISEGEHRLWFLDGKLLASVQKLPLPGDFRVNLDQGSQVRALALTAREKKAIPAVSRRLREMRIRLAAVDLIGGLVTDFNFTSPGLLTLMEEVLDANLAKPIIRKLGKKWS